MPSCAVASCTTTGRNYKERNLSLFHFPKDPNLCISWTLACNREYPINVKNALICSLHFDPQQIEGTLKNELLNESCKKTLIAGAIPTIRLSSEVCEDTQRVNRNTARCVRKRAAERLQNLSPRKRFCENTRTVGEMEDAGNVNEGDNFEIWDTSQVRVQHLEQKSAELQRQNNVLRKKLKASERREIVRKAQKCKWKNKHTAAIKLVRKEKQNSNQKVFSLLKSRFTSAQIRFMMFNKKKVNWDKEDILRALAVRALSKKAYLFIRKKMNIPLPGLSTLQRWTKHFQCQPGILHNVLEIMNNRPSSQFENYCVLSFDEMNIDSRICYDHQADVAYGPYSNAQVMMIRGVFHKWKQIVYYDFDVQVSRGLLLSIISIIEDAGYRVLACVSDLGGKNSGVWNDLNISEQNASFQNPRDNSRKVWVFADMPHMIKLLRNHILDEGLVLEDKTIVNRNIFVQLLEKDCGELKLCPKLTSTHVNCKSRERQRVFLATQLLSHHTAEALRDLMPEHEKVANFVQLVNDTFDVFNSSVRLDNSVALRSGFGMIHQEQTRILLQMRRECSRMRLCNKKCLLPFQRGILLSISSLIGLYKDICNIGANYLLTRRLNQDCLEHLFSQVRGLGRFYDHPLPSEVKSRLRLILIGTNTSSIPVCSSVQLDNEDDETKMITETMFKGTTESNETNNALESENEIRELLDEKADLIKSVQVSNARKKVRTKAQLHCEEEGLRYVAGYIAARMSDINPSLGTKIKNLPVSARTSWIAKLSTTGGLVEPSAAWLETVKTFEVSFTLYNGESVNKNENLISGLQQILEEKFPSIDKKIIRLYCRTRTFIRIKYLNKLATAEASVASTKKKAKKWARSKQWACSEEQDG